MPASERAPKVLLAKTSLDGHWRGIQLVARALRDAGFEVVLAGMARPEEITSIAISEDVDLIGLNIGGRLEIVERALQHLRDNDVHVPVIAGGTIPPQMARRLGEQDVQSFPPGSDVADIVTAARSLVVSTVSE